MGIPYVYTHLSKKAAEMWAAVVLDTGIASAIFEKQLVMARTKRFPARVQFSGPSMSMETESRGGLTGN